MTGITLSAEQIRQAPAEVRRWIEHEVATALGLQVQTTQRELPELVGCGHDELKAVLSLIQGVFPAVNVFFELGRKGTSCAQDRLEAYRLSDIQLHTRLQSTEQVLYCLNLINEALHQARGSTGDSFYGTEGDYCFIATETQQNIRSLWFELIGHRGMENGPVEATSAGVMPGGAAVMPGDRAPARATSVITDRPETRTSPGPAS